MANNEQWLFENSPRMTYVANGVTRTAGMKILAGMKLIKSGSVGQRVFGDIYYFGDFFTPGSVPVITTGILPGPGQWDVMSWCQGINQWLPDHRGVELYVASPFGNLTKDVWVTFHAIGV